MKTKYNQLSLETIKHYAIAAGLWDDETKRVYLIVGYDIWHSVSLKEIKNYEISRHRFWMTVFLGPDEMTRRQDEALRGVINPYLDLPSPQEIYLGMTKVYDSSQRLFVGKRRLRELGRQINRERTAGRKNRQLM